MCVSGRGEYWLNVFHLVGGMLKLKKKKTNRQSWVHSVNPTLLPQAATTPTQIPVNLGRFYRKHIVEKLPLPHFSLFLFSSSAAVIISSGVIQGVEPGELGLRNPLFHSSGVTTAKASHPSHDHLKRLQMKYPELQQLTCKVNPAKVSKPLTPDSRNPAL